MDSKQVVVFVVGIAAITACGAPQPHAQQAMPNRILTLSDAEQIAFTTAYLNRGMPVGDDQGAGDMTYLVLNRSSLVLPIIETKIEQVLKSPNPQDCFSVRNVDPHRFVGAAANEITYAADEQALKHAIKLLKFDEKRFGWMAESTLS